MNSPIPASILKTAPGRIWLDLGDEMHLIDPDTKFRDIGEVTWSDNNATGHGIEYVRASLSPVHAGAVPSGWQLVPIEPTSAMKSAGIRSAKMDVTGAWVTDAAECYEAMRAAAPSAPAEPAPGAAPVQGGVRIAYWHERIKKEHPRSEPEYWPSSIKAQYMEAEILDLRAALAAQPAATREAARPLPDHDNHHNALKCPYCNPRGLVFAEPAAPVAAASTRERA